MTRLQTMLHILSQIGLRSLPDRHTVSIIKILLLILLSPLTLTGQVTESEVVFASPDDDKSYKSKEEDEYYENNRYQDFVPLPIDVVKKHRLRHIKLRPSTENVTQEINDSDAEKRKRDIEFLNPKNPTAASVKRNSIMRYTNTKGVTATLFLDSKYDEFMWGEPGYWINLTDGNSSRDFYTGLAQNYYIKLIDTGENVWKNDSTLLFNAVRVRLIKPFVHPVYAPQYETIDNLEAEISISDLTRDSDDDGLTDIEEDKLMLNPVSSDSDGDGTNDIDDHNPRFKSQTTNETLVYKVVLDSYRGDTVKIRSNKIVNPRRPKLIHTSKWWTRLIVTDDTNLQKTDFDYNRTIIISGRDYSTYKSKFPISLDETNVSPLFKVDEIPDTFVISVSRDLGGEKYLVKKLNDGFDIIQIESWIH